MPTMASIVVKKADETTNITFDAIAGSSGENVAAKWRNGSSSEPVAFKPVMTTKAKPRNGDKIVTETLVVFPVTQTVDGITRQVNAGTFRLIANVPYSIDQAVINEMAHQSMNLLASVKHKEALKEGLSPRG